MAEISIIIPVYKAEKYIEKCVRSILNQSFEDFELILVEDGSPDDSGNICDSLAKEDKRVKVLHKKNGGVSSARNAGIDIAMGKYIMFCDSDDYVAPEWCQELYNLILQENVFLALCGYSNVSVSDNRKLGTCVYSNLGEKNQILPRKEFWNIYMRNLLNMPWNKIYKTDIIKMNKIRFDENLQYNEDLLFILEYIKHSEGFWGISNLTLNYYVGGIEGSLTRKYVHNLWDIKIRVFRELDATLNICGISKKNIETDYYSKWIWAIECSIANEMDIENRSSFARRFNNIFNITHSEVCKRAFELGKFEEYDSNMYVTVLKTKSAALIMLYHYFSCIRNKKKHKR